MICCKNVIDVVPLFTFSFFFFLVIYLIQLLLHYFYCLSFILFYFSYEKSRNIFFLDCFGLCLSFLYFSQSYSGNFTFIFRIFFLHKSQNHFFYVLKIIKKFSKKSCNLIEWYFLVLLEVRTLNLFRKIISEAKSLIIQLIDISFLKKKKNVYIYLYFLYFQAKNIFG